MLERKCKRWRARHVREPTPQRLNIFFANVVARLFPPARRFTSYTSRNYTRAPLQPSLGESFSIGIPPTASNLRPSAVRASHLSLSSTFHASLSCSPALTLSANAPFAVHDANVDVPLYARHRAALRMEAGGLSVSSNAACERRSSDSSYSAPARTSSDFPPAHSSPSVRQSIILASPEVRGVSVAPTGSIAQESFRSITRSYYRGAAGSLIVYDVTSSRSSENVRAHADAHVGCILVGTKVDLCEGDGHARSRAMEDAGSVPSGARRGLPSYLSTARLQRGAASVPTHGKTARSRGGGRCRGLARPALHPVPPAGRLQLRGLALRDVLYPCIPFTPSPIFIHIHTHTLRIQARYINRGGRAPRRRGGAPLRGGERDRRGSGVQSRVGGCAGEGAGGSLMIVGRPRTGLPFFALALAIAFHSISPLVLTHALATLLPPPLRRSLLLPTPTRRAPRRSTCGTGRRLWRKGRGATARNTGCVYRTYSNEFTADVVLGQYLAGDLEGQARTHRRRMKGASGHERDSGNHRTAPHLERDSRCDVSENKDNCGSRRTDGLELVWYQFRSYTEGGERYAVKNAGCSNPRLTAFWPAQGFWNRSRLTASAGLTMDRAKLESIEPIREADCGQGLGHVLRVLKQSLRTTITELSNRPPT
ncbi:hypothetical protein DFH09DRAFT_1075955 [Mycena vulgaris]|nr:hypothetical protein DFH09DRAFT_1075955 [Mycena vulgaris]